MDERIRLIFNGHESSVALYYALMTRVHAVCPDIRAKVRRDQVVLAVKRNFAIVWPSTDREEPVITLTLALPEHIGHPRIPVVKEVREGQFNHHIVLSGHADIDDELIHWVELAYLHASR